MSEQNATLERFWAALPEMPEDIRPELTALAVTDYWTWLDGTFEVDASRVDRVLGSLLFEMELLGDARVRQLVEMPYAEYLRTREWKARAKLVKYRADCRCQLCNADGPLETHHRTYERRGYERWNDLIALCPDCHEAFHASRKVAF